MRFFLDTANVDEARRVREWGLLDGILLNPPPDGAAKDARKLLSELAQVGDGPVLAPLSAGDPKGMYKEKLDLTGVAQGVYMLKVTSGDVVEVRKVIVNR